MGIIKAFHARGDLGKPQHAAKRRQSAPAAVEGAPLQLQLLFQRLYGVIQRQRRELCLLAALRHAQPHPSSRPFAKPRLQRLGVLGRGVQQQLLLGTRRVGLTIELGQKGGQDGAFIGVALQFHMEAMRPDDLALPHIQRVDQRPTVPLRGGIHIRRDGLDRDGHLPFAKRPYGADAVSKHRRLLKILPFGGLFHALRQLTDQRAPVSVEKVEHLLEAGMVAFP